MTSIISKRLPLIQGTADAAATALRCGWAKTDMRLAGAAEHLYFNLQNNDLLLNMT